MKPTFLLFSLFLLITAVCIPNPFMPEKVVYSTSFENAEDLKDWQGLSEENLVDVHAPGGGERAVLVSGGCCQPAAYIDLPTGGRGKFYTVSFWASIPDKNQSGTVALCSVRNHTVFTSAEVEVKNHDWAFYREEATIFCPDACTLRLEIRIGGIIAASMVLDLLEIKCRG